MGEAFYKSMKEDFDDKGNGYTVIIKSMDLKRVRSLQMFGIKKGVQVTVSTNGLRKIKKR